MSKAMKITVIVLACLLVVCSGVAAVMYKLYFLSTRSRIPAMPANIPEHQTTKLRADCLKCHLPEKMDALEAQRKHPLKWRDARINCLECHKSSAAKAQSALVSTP